MFNKSEKWSNKGGEGRRTYERIIELEWELKLSIWNFKIVRPESWSLLDLSIENFRLESFDTATTRSFNLETSKTYVRV